ncbi:hypothetical protein [Segetibacter koreensis]|uniref:hypothetical protein n=1 Tax=Segetibacter koreensis TaxID=398037 RepID=UPI00037027AB|nr:hypothetical protein [Segetibacter koreensis]
MEIAGTNDSSMFLNTSSSNSLHAYRLNKPNHKLGPFNPDDTYTSTTFRNSMKCWQQFYYGSSYLSQSSGRLTISPNIQTVVIYSFFEENAN